MLSLAGLCAAHAQSDSITLHISDFDIGQWNRQLVMGGDLSRAKSTLLDRNDRNVVGIAVPMPSDTDLRTLSDAELRADIEAKISTPIVQAYARGVRTFEVQLIQHIGKPGYVDPKRQAMVDTFGLAAYGALGNVVAGFESRGVPVASYAVTGSNGTEMLAASVKSLRRTGRTFLDGVDLIDGRAHMAATTRLIEAVGPRNVRIFNTRGDLPAPHTPLGFKSIANFDTAIDLKEIYPELRSYPFEFLCGLSELSMERRSKVLLHTGHRYT